MTYPPQHPGAPGPQPGGFGQPGGFPPTGPQPQMPNPGGYPPQPGFGQQPGFGAQPGWGPQPPKKNNTGLIIGLVIAAVVVLGGGGLLIALASSSGGSGSSASSDSGGSGGSGSSGGSGGSGGSGSSGGSGGSGSSGGSGGSGGGDAREVAEAFASALENKTQMDKDLYCASYKDILEGPMPTPPGNVPPDFQEQLEEMQRQMSVDATVTDVSTSGDRGTAEVDATMTMPGSPTSIKVTYTLDLVKESGGWKVCRIEGDGSIPGLGG